MGGFIDITTGGGCWMGSAADALIAALEKDVPLDRITFSSDGQGSMPRFNEAGEMVALAPLTATWKRCALPPKRLVLTKRSVR